MNQQQNGEKKEYNNPKLRKGIGQVLFMLLKVMGERTMRQVLSDMIAQDENAVKLFAKVYQNYSELMNLTSEPNQHWLEGAFYFGIYVCKKQKDENASSEMQMLQDAMDDEPEFELEYKPDRKERPFRFPLPLIYKKEISFKNKGKLTHEMLKKWTDNTLRKLIDQCYLYHIQLTDPEQYEKIKNGTAIPFSDQQIEEDPLLKLLNNQFLKADGKRDDIKGNVAGNGKTSAGGAAGPRRLPNDVVDAFDEAVSEHSVERSNRFDDDTTSQGCALGVKRTRQSQQPARDINSKRQRR